MTTPSVFVDRATKRYGSMVALNGVSFTVEPGEFFGLLGPNGAGKTTMINLMAGLARPDGGVIRIAGHDVGQDPYSVRRALGVVPQELVYDPFFTVRETLRLQSGYFSVHNNEMWIEEIMHHLGLTPQADLNMRALSGGMKRRVLVAQALVHRPQVIILDEPTAGVDIELREGLWQFISTLNQRGHTVLLTTHYLEEAQTYCQRIAMLKHGRIVALDHTQKLLATFPGVTLKVKFAVANVAPVPAGATLDKEGYHNFALHDSSEVPALLRSLEDQGLRCAEIDIHRADLGQVFHHLMQGA